MKRIWTIFLLAGLGSAAELTVFTEGDDAFQPAVTYMAKGQATKMFARIGVHVSWRAGVKPSGDGEAVQIRFEPANGRHPGATAFTEPFAPERVIIVFADRIAAITELRPDLKAPVLAHVLVHEIGHVLLRSNAHSPTGVMKARWSSADYSEMLRRPLRFEPEDAELIQTGLK